MGGGNSRLADSKRSVLVVDDDADIRSLLKDLLSEAGYTVRVAKSGAEAIEQIGKDLPDLVMMDVKLPDQDGIGVLRQLKREHPELEVIVMTAFGGSSTAIKAMEHGAYDYVTKPFEIDDLLADAEARLRARRHVVRGERPSAGARQARGRARAHRRQQQADAARSSSSSARWRRPTPPS